MDTVESLRAERDEAREAIRQLKQQLWEIVQPFTWADFRGLRLTRVERVILNALYEANGPLTYDHLRRLMDALFGSVETGNRISVQVCVARLRKCLLSLDRPVSLQTIRGVGYQIPDESKELLRARRVGPPEN